MAFCPDKFVTALKAATVDTSVSTGVATQAQQIWRMLDSMAESNPGEYEAFVSKQLKEGGQDMHRIATAKKSLQDSLRPSLIVHAPTLPQSKSCEVNHEVSIWSIAESSSEKVSIAVIALFEMVSAPAIRGSGGVWDPQKASVKELASCAIKFKVLHAPPPTCLPAWQHLHMCAMLSTEKRAVSE
jgi:hypothetical protein